MTVEDDTLMIRPQPARRMAGVTSADAQEGAGDVDPHEPLPFRQRDLLERPADQLGGWWHIAHVKRRIIDQDIDTAERLQRRVGHCLHGLRIGHVDRERQGRAAGLLNLTDRLIRPLLVDVGHDGDGAGGREGQRIGAA